MLMGKDREILDLKANIAEMLAVMPGSVPGSVSGLSAAPGGHRAGSGLFTPYSSASHTGELGIMDLPAGTGQQINVVLIITYLIPEYGVGLNKCLGSQIIQEPVLLFCQNHLFQN